MALQPTRMIHRKPLPTSLKFASADEHDHDRFPPLPPRRPPTSPSTQLPSVIYDDGNRGFKPTLDHRANSSHAANQYAHAPASASATALVPTTAPARVTASAAVSAVTGIEPLFPPVSDVATDGTGGKKTEISFWKTALDETKYLAGGLLQKPFESTRHYTILRHSSALTMYHGPATCVAVTVFSVPDHPIPADRTVWMQRRGFSGDTGLRLKSLIGASESWLDVTPERRISSSDILVADERGYQRDISRLLKKAKNGEKALKNRVARETLVVRIPATASDGYFRLVLCTGGPTAASSWSSETSAAASSPTAPRRRKVLCGSPIFRVASTSTDSSIFRGASLSTLPLEAGVYIASFLGTNAVSTVAEPIVSKVQNQVQNYQPGMLQTMAAAGLYDMSGAADKVDALDERYSQPRDMEFAHYGGEKGGDGFTREEGDGDVPPETIGSDDGPERPFPISLESRVVHGTGRSITEHGLPTANLASLRGDLQLRLRGVYFGWVSIVPTAADGDHDDQKLPVDWIEAIITVAPGQGPAVVAHKEAYVHILYDFGKTTFVGAKLKLILMGYLRSIANTHYGPGQTNKDALVTVTSLSRPRWGPQATLRRIETEKSSRSFSEKLVESKDKLHKQVDRIPLHWAGVRTSSAEMRDGLYGNGGFAIPR